MGVVLISSNPTVFNRSIPSNSKNLFTRKFTTFFFWLKAALVYFISSSCASRALTELVVKFLEGKEAIILSFMGDWETPVWILILVSIFKGKNIRPLKTTILLPNSVKSSEEGIQQKQIWGGTHCSYPVSCPVLTYNRSFL